MFRSALLFYFQAVTRTTLEPGVIAVIQTFRDRINFHPHLHFLVTEDGVGEAGLFHKIPRIDDSRLAEIFGREVLADLVRKELLSPEWRNAFSRGRTRDSIFIAGSVASKAHPKGWTALGIRALNSG